MEDQKWFNSVALALAVTLIVGLLLGLGLASNSPSGTSASSSSPTATDHLYLTIAFNPVTGMDQYFPANFSIPLNTPVVITITSYDTGLNQVPAAYSSVIGTTNNMMTFNDGMGGPSQTLSSVALTHIGHTFTIMSMGSGGMGGGMMGGGGQPRLNVPIPAASNASLPVSVTFTTTFATPGVYTWMCLAPCDRGSMATPGLMTGTVTVS